MRGALRYGELSPIKYDIMGPFSVFPMECSHGIVSMRHRLEGEVCLNGKIWDFTDGIGYIEKDSGRSFPSSYLWIQANDFAEPASIMAAVAVIPVGIMTEKSRTSQGSRKSGLHFRGCICVIQYRGKEYRLATYLGVRVRVCSRKRLVLTQGKYCLDVRVKETPGHGLSAPDYGKMSRRILEAAACPAEFRFYVRGKQLFRLRTKGAGFEWASMEKEAFDLALKVMKDICKPHPSSLFVVLQIF